MNNFTGSKINNGGGTSTATHSATGVNITSSCQVGEARQRMTISAEQRHNFGAL